MILPPWALGFLRNDAAPLKIESTTIPINTPSPLPPSNSLTMKPPKPQSSIATHMETVIRDCICSINDHTFESHLHPMWSYVSPDFEITHDTVFLPVTKSKIALIEGFQAILEKFPDYRIDIFSCSAEIDSRRGTGRLFVNAQETGGEGVPRGLMVGSMPEGLNIGFRWLTTRVLSCL